MLLALSECRAMIYCVKWIAGTVQHYYYYLFGGYNVVWVWATRSSASLLHQGGELCNRSGDNAQREAQVGGSWPDSVSVVPTGRAVWPASTHIGWLAIKLQHRWPQRSYTPNQSGCLLKISSLGAFWRNLRRCLRAGFLTHGFSDGASAKK